MELTAGFANLLTETAESLSGAERRPLHGQHSQ